MNLSIHRLLAKTLLSGALLLLFCASCVGRSTTPPPIDYVKEGVNTEHLFIFTDTTMTYNGKPFMPGMTIEEMCEVFGLYDRVPEEGIYLWDSIGLTMTTWRPNDPHTNVVNVVNIDWHVQLNDWGLGPEYEDKELRERCPRHYFQGNIIVGGAVLGRGMQINTFLEKTTFKFRNNPLPLIYVGDLFKWDYLNVPISEDEKFTYQIKEADDQASIESFWVCIDSRRFGDPGFVLGGRDNQTK